MENFAPDVSDLNIGEAVYALTDFWRAGAAADYVTVHAGDLAPKPASLSHTQAAAVPLSALTAWQALFDHAALSSGQRVLIQGAAGGVGSYAVQLAQGCGAYVIGTAQGASAGLLRELGADEVVDYTATRFEDKVRDVNVVLDAVGGDTLERSWGVLRRGGVLVTIAGSAPADRAAEYGVRGVEFIVKPNRAQLIEIGRLIDAGRLRPIIEATFPLENARAAFARGLEGHNRGKIVLQVAEQTSAHTDVKAEAGSQPLTRTQQILDPMREVSLRIAVVGAGVVGGYFGGHLAHAGQKVVFVERGRTLQALREHVCVSTALMVNSWSVQYMQPMTQVRSARWTSCCLP